MTTPSPNRSRRLPIVGLVALALVAGVTITWAVRRPSGHTEAEHAQEQAAGALKKKQMYQCPMHPQVIMDHEGDCPICGMRLVPMVDEAPPAAPQNAPAPQGGSGPQDLATVTIDAQRQQLIGLRTEPAAEGDLGGELRTVGRVAVDETRVRRVTVKVEGFVERLFVDFTGQAVGKGQPLFSLYSPEFVSAQQEYLLAMRTQKQLSGGAMQESGTTLLDSARQRLMFWDVPAAEVARLEQTGEVRKTLTLRSPISGIVTQKNIVEGARVTPLDPLYEITDLARVWVLADVYESELARVKVGTPADLSLGAYHGRSFRGRVAFIDPQVDPKTRTVKVRIEFPNPKGELKPEMFGEVSLQSGGRKGLTVPLDAVLDSGTRKVVFVALGGGRFEPREVRTGSALGERVEILEGLRAGEEVITRANFLVDSESRLKAALAQMTEKP